MVSWSDALAAEVVVLGLDRAGDRERRRVRLAARAVRRREAWRAGANSNQSRFWPSPAKVSLRVCVPAVSVTGTPTSRNVANDPVFGTAIVAIGAPSTESAMVRPVFGLATRAVTVYVPAVVTFTV